MSWFRPEFFYLLIYKPSYCNFLESRKKISSKNFFLFYPLTLNIICFVEKNNIVFGDLSVYF